MINSKIPRKIGKMLRNFEYKKLEFPKNKNVEKKAPEINKMY